jgi:hypothetical protein
MGRNAYRRALVGFKGFPGSHRLRGKAHDVRSPAGRPLPLYQDPAIAWISDPKTGTPPATTLR